MIQNNGHVCLLWVYVIKKEYINNYHNYVKNEFKQVANLLSYEKC